MMNKYLLFRLPNKKILCNEKELIDVVYGESMDEVKTKLNGAIIDDLSVMHESKGGKMCSSIGICRSFNNRVEYDAFGQIIPNYSKTITVNYVIEEKSIKNNKIQLY